VANPGRRLGYPEQANTLLNRVGGRVPPVALVRRNTVGTVVVNTVQPAEPGEITNRLETGLHRPRVWICVASQEIGISFPGGIPKDCLVLKLRDIDVVRSVDEIRAYKIAIRQTVLWPQVRWGGIRRTSAIYVATSRSRSSVSRGVSGLAGAEWRPKVPEMRLAQITRSTP